MKTNKRIVIVSCLALMMTAVFRLHATVALWLSADELILQADRVVIASLREPGRAAWDAAGMHIYTTYRFDVEEDLKGTGNHTVEIIQPGGEVGDLGQWVAGTSHFRPQERVLLFLAQISFGGYRTVGMSQGVFDFQSEPQIELLVQRVDGLAYPDRSAPALRLERQAFLAKIRSAARGQQP